MTEAVQKKIFEEWLSGYRALLFKVVRSYSQTRMDQEDLFQEIAIQVWHSVPSFRSESGVVTWLYRIALNTAIKWSKKEHRHSARTEALEKADCILQDTRVQSDDRLTWLYEEIAKLDEIDRSLTLLLLEDFSYREMAAILGITESNVGVKIVRIKKHLITKSNN